MSGDGLITYDDAKEALLSLLTDSHITTIEIFQFDFLVMYFPFYMVINDLKNSGITITFDQSIENDEKIIEKMAKDDFESFRIDGEYKLRIGLCEPLVFNKETQDEENKIKGNSDSETLNNHGNKNGEIKAKENEEWSKFAKILDNECVENGKNSFFIHLPFISFPPLYGVSLINRPVINKIKKKKSKDKTTRNEGDEKKVLSIIDYWRHFSAKLSLLDKNDFQNLVASSYPKGSTTDWFIRKKIRFPLKGATWIENLSKEFDDLFNGLVDVAFTVQPWAAVSQSEFHDPPLDVDIVYKNVCDQNFDCTSLIFKTKEKEYLIFGDYILNCFNVLLKEKINELYRMDSNGIKETIKEYCKLIVDACKNNKKCSCVCCDFETKAQKCQNREKVTNGNNNDVDTEDGCLFENKMALRLINDSQIYKYLKKIKRNHKGMDIEKVVVNYFVEKFKEDPDKLLSMLFEVKHGRKK